jgi:NAD-dependent deacetylase
VSEPSQATDFELAAAALRSASGGRLLVVTGAGISRASGIATFRGGEPGAVWRRHDVELATHDYFRRDPVGQWRWYLERFDGVDRARPNAAHAALARLTRHWRRDGGDPVLVTQNIDCLHERAGSEDVIKVHGSSDRVRCSASGRCRLAAPTGSLARSDVDLAPFRADPALATVPRCPACGALLRAHVLFFDEYYAEHADYRFAEVERAAARCDVAFFVGTSFSVGVTDLVLRQALGRRRPILSLDPAGLPPGLPGAGILALRAAAEEALPRLCEALAA